MKKIFFVYLLHLFCYASALAAPYKGERLYPIEIFEKNKPGTQEGLVLLVSSLATWGDLKAKIEVKLGIDIEDRIVFLLNSTFRIKEKEQKVTSDESVCTFFYILQKHDPFWQYPWYFDKMDFQAMRQNRVYRLAEMSVPQLKRMPISEKGGRSVFVKGHDGRFQLMSIDSYHKVRKGALKRKGKVGRRCPTPFPKKIRQTLMMSMVLDPSINVEDVEKEEALYEAEEMEEDEIEDEGSEQLSQRYLLLLFIPAGVVAKKYFFPFQEESEHSMSTQVKAVHKAAAKA